MPPFSTLTPLALSEPLERGVGETIGKKPILLTNTHPMGIIHLERLLLEPVRFDTMPLGCLLAFFPVCWCAGLEGISVARWLIVVAGVLVAVLALVYGVRFFGGNRPVSAAKLVEQALSDPVPEQQQQAVAALVTLPQAARRESSQRLIKESTSPQILSTAILDLAGQWDYDSMPRMVELLDDPSLDVRAAAGSAVQRMMSVDFGFRATDPPEKRRLVAAQLQKHWEWLRDSQRLKSWKARLESGEIKGRGPRAN